MSFSVRLSTATSFTANTVIKYDTVTTNIGAAYSTADGKFTAPFNGTYQVSFLGDKREYDVTVKVRGFIQKFYSGQDELTALFTNPFPRNRQLETTPRDRSTIDGFRDGTVERWNSTSQIMEQPGTVRPASLLIALLVVCQQVVDLPLREHGYLLFQHWELPSPWIGG